MVRVRPVHLAAAVLLAACRCAPAAPLPLTDNVSPPILGVWANPEGVDQVAGWLNRSLLWGDTTLAFHDCKDWHELETLAWVSPKWDAWVAARPGRRLVTGVPMFAGQGMTLAEGATGVYNDHFTTMAKLLVARGLGGSVLRLGWAFNGGPSWRVKTAEDAANFIRCWRQIVGAIRAVPGTEKLQFVWEGINAPTGYKLEDAWPGDDQVDFVGMEAMDICFDADVYPYPPDATEEVRLSRQRLAWERIILPVAHNGLLAWSAVAKAHGKPFCIPQWGLYADHHGGCGFDNPYFVQRMHDFIQDPANRVYFATYFNYYHACKISPTGPDGTNYPRASALFHQLFALPKP